jgi:histone chaperone ASF1
VRLFHLHTHTHTCPHPDPDIEWKLTFVSCPDDEQLDQELDSLVVGPIPKGINQFEFDASPPDPTLIRKEDVLGVSALIFTGSYKEQEFVRVGYYQNTEFDADELKEEWEGSTRPVGEREIRYERLVRDISTKPRVTRFQIRW